MHDRKNQAGNQRKREFIVIFKDLGSIARDCIFSKNVHDSKSSQVSHYTFFASKKLSKKTNLHTFLF